MWNSYFYYGRKCGWAALRLSYLCDFLFIDYFFTVNAYIPPPFKSPQFRRSAIANKLSVCVGIQKNWRKMLDDACWRRVQTNLTQIDAPDILCCRFVCPTLVSNWMRKADRWNRNYAIWNTFFAGNFDQGKLFNTFSRKFYKKFNQRSEALSSKNC